MDVSTGRVAHNKSLWLGYGCEYLESKISVPVCAGIISHVCCRLNGGNTWHESTNLTCDLLCYADHPARVSCLSGAVYL